MQLVKNKIRNAGCRTQHDEMNKLPLWRAHEQMKIYMKVKEVMKTKVEAECL